MSSGTDRLEFGAFAQPNGETVISNEAAQTVLKAAVAGGVRGVLWTGGGEPTLLRSLDDLCVFGAALGITNAIYTNGILFGVDPDIPRRLMMPRSSLAFIRLSLNALSAKAVRSHWGVKNPVEILAQLRGLDAVLRARTEQASLFTDKALPSVQISTIIDKRNESDLLAVCEAVAEVFSRYPAVRGCEDVMVVRPIIRHRQAMSPDNAYDASAVQAALAVCGRDGPGRALLDRASVRTFLGFGLDELDGGAVSRYSDLIHREYQERVFSWSHGLFLTVGPDGSVYPCMELNCDRHWVLGNLLNATVDEIYRGAAYHRFAAMANEVRWRPPLFHPFSRTARLDRIATAVTTGELTDSDIDAIRTESMRSHQLLLN